MTVGDPRGIGPEVVSKALADPGVRERCDVVVIGPDGGGAEVTESIGRWRPGSDAAQAGMLSGLAIERAVARVDGTPIERRELVIAPHLVIRGTTAPLDPAAGELRAVQ